MGFWGRVRDWWMGEQPEQRAVTSVPWNIGGVSSATINQDKALRLFAVYGATRLLADNIASLPLDAYRRLSDLTRRPVTSPLLLSPSIHGTRFDWMHRLVVSLALRGNAYGLITAIGSDGYPTRVEWLHPDRVDIHDDDTSVAPRWYLDGRPVDAGSLVHIPLYTLPGKVLGVSPIGAFASVIGTGLSAQDFGRNWFDNGAIPSGIVSNSDPGANGGQPVSQEQSAQIKARFKEAAGGRDVVVMSGGWDFRAITVSPNESQFLETIQATATQIAAIYGVPPDKIGGKTGDSLTYATVELNTIDFLQMTLRPYLVRIEQALSRLLPRPQYVQFNADAMIRTDLKSRIDAEAAQLEAGLLDIDEARALEDRPPADLNAWRLNRYATTIAALTTAGFDRTAVLSALKISPIAEAQAAPQPPAPAGAAP